MIDPQVLKQTRIEAIRTRLTVGNVVEQALQEYLQRVRQQQREQVEIKFRLG